MSVAYDMNSDFQEAFEELCSDIQIIYDYFQIIKNIGLMSEIQNPTNLFIKPVFYRINIIVNACQQFWSFFQFLLQNNRKGNMKILNLPDDEVVIGIIGFGYPDYNYALLQRKRQDKSEIAKCIDNN